jgi:hypothetical protein
MTIGQITISAADWLASRVSDRIALVVAGQTTDLAQQLGSKAVQPPEENIGALLDRRERERSIHAAQESYKRVAQRIKSRLATPLTPPDPQAIPRSAAERAAMIESLRNSPKLATTIIAAEQKAETPSTSSSASSRPDALFGLAETDQKKAEDRQAASVDEKEKEATLGDMIRTTINREDAIVASGTTPLFEKGLWDDLFVAENLTQEA